MKAAPVKAPDTAAAEAAAAVDISSPEPDTETDAKEREDAMSDADFCTAAAAAAPDADRAAAEEAAEPPSRPKAAVTGKAVIGSVSGNTAVDKLHKLSRQNAVLESDVIALEDVFEGVLSKNGVANAQLAFFTLADNRLRLGGGYGVKAEHAGFVLRGGDLGSDDVHNGVAGKGSHVLPSFRVSL